MSGKISAIYADCTRENHGTGADHAIQSKWTEVEGLQVTNPRRDPPPTLGIRNISSRGITSGLAKRCLVTFPIARHSQGPTSRTSYTSLTSRLWEGLLGRTRSWRYKLPYANPRPATSLRLGPEAAKLLVWLLLLPPLHLPELIYRGSGALRQQRRQR